MTWRGTRGLIGGSADLSAERLYRVCLPASGAIPPALELSSRDAFLLPPLNLLPALIRPINKFDWVPYIY